MNNLNYGQLSRLTIGPRSKTRKRFNVDIGRSWRAEHGTKGRREFVAWTRTNFTANFRMRLRGDPSGWLYKNDLLTRARYIYAPWLEPK